MYIIVHEEVNMTCLFQHLHLNISNRYTQLDMSLTWTVCIQFKMHSHELQS